MMENRKSVSSAFSGDHSLRGTGGFNIKRRTSQTESISAQSDSPSLSISDAEFVVNEELDYTFPGCSKYRRLDTEGSREFVGSNFSPSTVTPGSFAEQSPSRLTAGDDSADRFLFVSVGDSPTRQRSRLDQRAINAHIQQTAHRNKRQEAAERLKARSTANIGRFRKVIQTRDDVPPHVAPQSSPTRTESPVRQDEPQEVVQKQLDRLRYYSATRAPEAAEVVDDERLKGEDELSLASAKEPSVRTMLSQILHRLDAGHFGHDPQSRPDSVLGINFQDPFNIGSVQITESMNGVLRHCKSLLLCTKFSNPFILYIPDKYFVLHLLVDVQVHKLTIHNWKSRRSLDTRCFPNTKTG